MSSVTTIQVTGMTCQHCINAVREELLTVPGIEDVTVDLRPGEASQVHMQSDTELDVDAVTFAIDEAGYELA